MGTTLLIGLIAIAILGIGYGSMVTVFFITVIIFAIFGLAYIVGFFYLLMGEETEAEAKAREKEQKALLKELKLRDKGREHEKEVQDFWAEMKRLNK